MSAPLIINYYTDILCVWAWVAQRRIDELEDQWHEKIEFRPHYIDLFGDTASRIGKQWKDRGGYEAFGNHVLTSSASYENAPVNQDIWKKIRPATSANAHLVLKAVELAYSTPASFSFATTVRKSFFVDMLDIGQLENLLSLAGKNEFDADKLQFHIENGTAMAALMQDYQNAQKLGLKGSPSWVMNDGRQILYGNVGYRILNANIKEIIEYPSSEASWC